MRKFFAVVIACLLIVPLASATTDKQIDSKDTEQVVLFLLTEPMLDAIEQYYGQPRLFWEDSGKLLSIRQAPDALAYEVVTQVETFTGPHNPPYGIETMTFLVGKTDVALLNFEHEDTDT